jgi:oxygen-independent coproporphyrinogen-3 oxidase
MEFFMKLVNSHVADGYSLYTLELFPGSSWYNQTQQNNQHVQWLQGNEEGIYEEFDILQTIIKQAGYDRYEVSNFALRSKPSIHNLVYRDMQLYIGLGINSSSFLPHKLLSSS